MGNITVDHGASRVGHEAFRFSGGEIQVRLGADILGPAVNITALLASSDDIMELLLLTDALRRARPGIDIRLVAPYLPYARQDRVCSPGEALSLRVICDLINSQRYSRVEIWDAHSDVAPALLSNCTNYHASRFLRRFTQGREILVSPDAGANKKVQECAKLFRTQMVRADKTRSVATGEITGTVVYSEHVGKQDFLIVDDICDGGRTFIELAKVLRPKTDGKIYLYATHGIFSKGVEVFEGLLDGVFCPNVFPNVPEHSLLTRAYGE